MKGLANPPYTHTKIVFPESRNIACRNLQEDVIEVVTDEMPAGEAIMDPTHHLIGDKGRSD